MSNQEDFFRPEKPLQKTQQIDSEAIISKKAKMTRKFNRNQERIAITKLLNTLKNEITAREYRRSLVIEIKPKYFSQMCLLPLKPLFYSTATRHYGLT